MTSELDIFGLIAFAEISAVERNKFEPHEFFGREEDIKAIKENPLGAIHAILQREWPDVKWDGTKGTMRMAAVTRLIEICRRDRGETHMLLNELHGESARKILASYRANGGVSRTVVEEAEKVLAAIGDNAKKMEGAA